MSTLMLHKNRLLRALALIGVIALVMGVKTFIATPRAAGANSVVAVPWLGSEVLAHQVEAGASFTLQAVATDPNGNAITLTAATWDKGDGSPVAITLTNSLVLERTVTYTGSVGQPFTAVIRVTDTGGNVYTDTMNVVIGSVSRETKVNMAIDKGLWYLHKQLARVTVDGKAGGYWLNNCCSDINNKLAGTAPAVQAFEINNHRESGDRLKDPYVDDVQRGLRFLMSTTGQLIARAKVTQGANNPDANNNLFVLNSSPDDHSIYLGGQVMDAIVASGTPNKTADVGYATYVNGRAYKDIVQDMIDGYSQGMNDDKGGWLYTPNDGTVGGYASFDVSSSHWWAAGVLAAEGWGLDAPLWVKNLLKNNGMPTAHTATTATGNCSWYYRGDNYGAIWDGGHNVSAAGLILMNAADMPQTDVLFGCTSRFLAATFASSKGNPYTMYQLTKGMRTALNGSGVTTPIAMLNGTIDWYAQYADYLIANQNGLGSGLMQWNNGSTAGGYITGSMSTAWGVIILSPSLFELPPSAACTATPSTLPTAGGTVNFSAAASFHPDPAATIASYNWTFGDGATQSIAAPTATTSHAYAQPASWPTVRSATVTVTDSRGNSATASCPVTIQNTNVPPTVTSGGPYTMCVGANLTLTATATDADSTITATGWDWTSPVNNLAFDATGLVVNATAAFTAKGPGVHNVGFRATDNFNASSDVFTTVTVLAANNAACNQPPTIVVPANIVREATSPAGASVTFTATATDDHDTITPVCTPPSGSTFGINPTTSKTTAVNCTATDSSNLSASGSFNVTVQDTTPPVITIPANITVHATSSAGAVVNYTATAADIVDPFVPVICNRPSGVTFQLGVTTMVCTATDQHNNTSTSTFTINVTNAPPAAVDDVITTHGSTAINVLANDSDPDGDVLTVSLSGGFGFANGTVTVNADKTIQYVPNLFQSQSGSFNYTINDGRGGTSTARVTVNITNAVPVAVNDTITFAHNVTTMAIPVLGNDSDPENDSLTVTQVNQGPNCHCQGFVINANGTVTYTSIPNAPNTFSSPAQFTYTIRDKYGATATATVTVTFANQVPAASPYFVTTHGAPVTVNLLTNATDPDGDTMSVVSACGGAIPPQVGFCTFAAGTMTFTPNSQWFGPQIQLGYTVTDGHSANASSFVSITYVNQLPVPGHPAFTTLVNTPLQLNELMLLQGGSDPDGDALSIPEGVTVQHGTLLNNGQDQGIYTPNLGFIGVDTLSFVVDDDHGGLVNATATINVSAPTTTTIAAPGIVYGSNGVITVTVGSAASTSPVGALSLSIAGGPAQTQQLVNGSATFSMALPVAGDYPLAASYAGQDYFLTSAGVGTLHVSKAPSATVVNCSTAAYNGAAQETCSANVTGVGGLNEALSVSYANNINVGTATGSASYAGDANHEGSSSSATFQITPATTTTVVTCSNVVYNGAAQESCTANVSGAGNFSQALPVSYLNNVNVGTAKGSASYGGDANHDGSSSSATFEITPAATTMVVTCADAVYNGAAQTTCSANVTGAGGLTQVLPVSYANNVNVGTATGSASYTGDANHAASSSAATFEITPAATTTVVTCADAVYNGAAQETCTANVTGAGGLNQPLTVSYLNNVNVGPATGSASYTGDANHAASNSAATFEITPAATTTVVTCSNVVYDGEAQTTCAANVTGAGGLNQVLPVSYANNVNVGTATGSASYTGDANHAASNSAATFEITPAGTITVVTCSDAVYTGAAQETCTANVTGAGGLNQTLTVSYQSNVNVGTAKGSATYAGDANHSGSDGSKKFEITPAPTTTVVTCSDVVYTGAAQTACTANVTGAGGLNQVLPLSYANNVNVGTATGSASYTGDANHAASNSAATFEITPAATATVVTCADAVFTGAAQTTCSASVTGAGGLSQVLPVSYLNNVIVGTATGSASYPGDANHIASNSSATFEITPAATTTVVTCADVIYTGAAQTTCSANVTGAGGLSQVLPVSYANNVIVGTATGSASYPGDANHIASNSSATFEITPAATTTVVTCADVIYTGAAQTTCSANVTGAGGLSQVLPVSYANNVIVGTATGSASYPGDANHIASNSSATFEITPAPSVTVVTCPASVIYSGAAQAPCTANVTGVGGLDQAVTPVTYTANTNVGTAGASATFGGDANHTTSTGGATFEITQAATSTAINAPTITVAANGAVTVTVTSGSGTVLGSVSLSVDGGAAVTQALVGGSTVFTVNSPNAGDHGLVASYAAQGNFSASGTTGNLHVNPSPTKTTLTTSATPQLAGTPVIFTATVIATAPGSGTPNGVVTFKEGATILGTGTLSAAGVATFTTTTLANGPHTITASYDGVNNYLPSNANTVSKLIFGLATGGGTFVIGDNNAVLNNQVMFWGAQWEKNNSMTGGSSNASFKGFAISPAVPTVGATFTSAPGNSAPPPAGVPQYLGIIVTSKVTKSGSNITGTIVKLVVVRVDAGYQGNPGHAGTGTIVAFVQ